MKINDIFTNILFVDSLNIDNEQIINYCYNNDLNDKKKTNYLSFNEPELQLLYGEIKIRVDALHTSLGFSNKGEQVFKNAWFNINRTPYIDAPHIHQGMLFTIVYYPKADLGKSKIRFVNPNSAHAFSIYPAMLDTYNRFNSGFWDYEPKTGDLIIFPSWLMHYVIQEETETDRISIALNTYYTEK